MKKSIKSTELRREDVSNSGQFYSSKTVVKQFDNNSELLKETYKYEQAQNNGHSNIEEVKEFNEGKLIHVVKIDFTKTHQIDYSYFDNIQIKENRLVQDDNSQKKESLNDLISVEKRFSDSIGRVTKITFEDYKNPENDFITEVKHVDTTNEFDNNGLFTTEITRKGDRIISKRNVHLNGKKCETISNFNSKGFVKDIENKVIFSENSAEIITSFLYVRKQNNSFQLKNLKLEVIHKEVDGILHKVNLVFEYNELHKGKIVGKAEEIKLFQVSESKADILNKINSLFENTNKCYFQYFRIIDGRPLEEIDTQFTFKDVFENISDIFPATLIYENIINRFMDDGNYINYIQIPFSPDNQDYYLRVWNNQKCGYYKVEYS